MQFLWKNIFGNRSYKKSIMQTWEHIKVKRLISCMISWTKGCKVASVQNTMPCDVVHQIQQNHVLYSWTTAVLFESSLGFFFLSLILVLCGCLSGSNLKLLLQYKWSLLLSERFYKCIFFYFLGERMEKKALKNIPPR